MEISSVVPEKDASDSREPGVRLLVFHLLTDYSVTGTSTAAHKLACKWSVEIIMAKEESDAAAARRARREPLLVAIGDRIRKLREEAGLSQRDMGERAGLTQTYIYMTEVGGSNATVMTLEKIANALGVPVSYLLIDAKSENNYSELLAITGKHWQKLLDMLSEDIERSIRNRKVVEEWIEEYRALTQESGRRIEEKK